MGGLSAAAQPDHLQQPFSFKAVVPFGQTLAKVVLTAPMSITHGQDPNQRCVMLTFSVANGIATVSGQSPRSLVPPGLYLLWMVSSAGVPSEARWVRVQ